MADSGKLLAAKFGAMFPHLDERQRRLLMGAEARALGHGGIRVVARAAGVREATVSLGAAELERGEEPLGRVRREGGGRKRLAELDPGLRPALLALVEPDERGDPMSPLRWTTKSLRALSAELARQGHRAGPDTVAGLLHEEGFSLQGNAKTIEGNQVPDRDAQFRYLNEQVREHRDAGEPVISVDTKKKELVGDYRNGGREWRPAGDPVRVRDHDFPDQELGKAIPYGIYDLAANTGWVNVGTDHDTAQFAVESIRRWWNDAGRAAYPGARRLLITADSGGSNSSRARAWKLELAALALGTGLEITACHFPPGTSKWNKIEHRLFSHITMNWRGRPLTSHQVIVAAISATATGTGLAVRAELDTGIYPAGVKISDEQMAALPLRRHDWHGDWNYTLYPAQPAAVPAPAPPPGRGERPGWTHPALTGMTARDWDQLTAALAVPYQAQLEAGRHIARGGPATRLRAGGHPAAMTLAEKTLLTVMRQRLGVPRPVMADLFGVSANTIATAERQIKPLLERAGHTAEPAAARCATLAELTAYAASHGITLTPKIKPAR
ncbi:MAG TPA: ISAzo13 family transposase [Streptosporangiaceae bacterium]|jgi:transposase|nr:ISAzo13 family transposase [Streptosporangiaceae bacterium]